MIRNLKHWLLAALVLLPVLGCDRGADGAAEEEEHADEAMADSGQVTLTAAAMQTAQIAVEPALGEVTAGAAAGLEVPGEVRFDQRRVAIISPRVAGRLERVHAVEGDQVRGGEVVAELFTTAFISAQTDYLLARRRAETLRGTQDAGGASALVDAAERRLRILGTPTGVVQAIGSSGDVRETLPITAPFSGSIVEVSAMPGAAIESGSPIFKIANLAFVDVAAAVPEQALPLVRTGLKATVHLAAYPGVQFDGTVERMDQQLDAATRTVHAIIHVANSNGRLVPGMFATVRLHTPVTTGAPNSGLQIVTIPESAVVNDGEARIVFVEIRPGTFQRRIVDVASLEAPGASQPLTNRVVVRSGLQAGERVVVRGAFTLKSELGKAAFGDEH